MTNNTREVEEKLETYFPADLRMRAYYYGFKPTGTREVDKILSAVAIAGKAYHSTDQWIDEMYEEGVTAEKLIQYAADTASFHIHRQLQKAREEEREKWTGNDAYSFLGNELHLYCRACIDKVKITRNGEVFEFTLPKDHSELDQPINSIFKE